MEMGPFFMDKLAPLPLKKEIHAPVAQLDRVAGFEPVGREFESLRVRQ
jgi:hypothetical protein